MPPIVEVVPFYGAGPVQDGRVHAHRLGRLTERGVHEHFLPNSLCALVTRAPIRTAHPVADMGLARLAWLGRA